ncbi:MAG: alcohol dehydrogenase catalytic domain-containing protein [Verrucomicrobiota bacterium]|nr:alcohol dehydrogenase catalytic domain-containing protein [Verrucomicrobiota bacterium]
MKRVLRKFPAWSGQAIPQEMQAVVYRGKNQMVLEQVPVPRIGREEILVKVAACGVCPTDIKKIVHGALPPPRIYGHETAGIVVKTGAAVQGFEAGERVGLHHHVPCMKCHACRHRAFSQCPGYKQTGVTAGFEAAGGGYAEYVRVMSFCLPGVVKIPRKNSFIEGAMLEPVNTVLKGVRMLHLQPGDRVLVAGAGPIGLLFTQLLSLFGVIVFVTDLLENRLLLARRFGAREGWLADRAETGEKIREATKGLGLDAAVIAVPSDAAVKQAQELLRGGGELLLFAHTKRGMETSMDLSSICVDEKQLIGSYSSDFTLQKEVARLVFSRKLDVAKLVTHEFELADTAKAIALAAAPTPESLKVVVRQVPG